MNSRFAAFVSLGILFVGCGGPKNELDSKIEESLSDQRIDATEVADLRAFVQENGDNLADDKVTEKLPEGGDAALLAYIKRSPTYRKLKKEGDEPTLVMVDAASASKPLALRLYLEASGSMFPYDAPSTNGEFKRTLNQVINGFEAVSPGQTELFVVNTEVNPLGMNQSQFTKQANIFTVAKTKGQTSSTDFEKIFSEILRNTGGSSVSVLASDLIYSDPELRGQSVEKTLNAADALMTNVFNDYADTHSMLVVKLLSDFDGPYYPAAGGTVRHNAQRPYYLCFIGRNATMQQLMQNGQYAAIRNFRGLPGYQDFWFFTKDKEAAEPFYTILTKDPARKGQFDRSSQALKTRAKAVHALQNVKSDVTGKGLRIPVAVNLSKLNLPESFLTDVSQYEVEGKDQFRVEKIEPYTGSGATHKLWLTTSQAARGDRPATIRLKRQFPPRWVAETSTSSDAKPDTKSTFGLQNLLQGVESAYNPAGARHYFELPISIKE